MAEDAEIQRRLRRYRVMFRTTLLLGAAGVVGIVYGVVYLAAGESNAMLSGSIIFAVLAVLLAYKIVLSTMKLLDRAKDEGIDLG